MNNKTFLVIGILLGAVASWVVFSITAKNNVQQGTMIRHINKLDAHFIEQMIPHHEGAIEMAKLALTKSQRPEVQELSKSIIVSQGKEIVMMKAWYRRWYGQEVPSNAQGMMHHGMMGDSDTMLETLNNSENFDVDFIHEMIPHHEQAIMMADMLKSGTERSEMKKLAEDIITAQTKEIDMMNQWLKEWNN